MRFSGVSAGVSLWARREIGSRWRSLIVLGVLAGVAGGLALAAVAGARRTDTAYARFRERTGRSDAIVFATQLGVSGADYSAVRRLPEVVDAGEFLLAPIGIKGFPGGSLPPGDDHLYRTINRPLLTAGRLPDPRRDDEVLVNRAAARLAHLSVGSKVTLVSSRDPAGFYGKPLDDGPSVGATVVGVGDSNMDLAFGGQDEPGFIPSFGFLSRHPEIPRDGNLVVHLRPGTNVTAFRQRVADAMGLPTIPVRDQAEDGKRITHATDLQRSALLLFAAAVALAGVVLVGQTLARTVYAMAESAPILRAIGLTRGGLVAGLVLALGTAAAAAAGVALVVAVALSTVFPVGLAGRLEPNRGLHLDWLVVLPGVLAVVAVVLGGAALGGLRATASQSDRPPPAPRSSVTRFLRSRAPVTAGIGAGLALERGSGRRTLPVWPAIAGATAGVLGIVGAFGLLRGINDALAQPDRSGQVWHAEIAPTQDHPESTIVAALGSEPVVASARQLRIDLDVNGAGLPVYALDPIKADQSFTVLHGRRPSRPDDVVLGPATARALHRGIGDKVRIGGPQGRDVHVVGLGLLLQTPHSAFDQGAWMTRAGLGAIAPHIDPNDRTVVVRFAGRQPHDAAIGRLQAKLGPDVEIDAIALPEDVTYLRDVRSLPKALAGFLALLGVCALGHALVTAVRRRRHDLAVLRALGFRPLQVAGSILWQALIVSVLALAVGVPLGLAAGRWSWRWVANAIPLRYVGPLPAAVMIALVPLALLSAGLISVWPARRAARLRPAEVLRTE